jgi:hypothetical protein
LNSYCKRLFDKEVRDGDERLLKYSPDEEQMFVVIVTDTASFVPASLKGEGTLDEEGKE